MPLFRPAQSQYIAIAFVDHDHFGVRWKSSAYRIADSAEEPLRTIRQAWRLSRFADAALYPAQRLSRQWVIVQH